MQVLASSLFALGTLAVSAGMATSAIRLAVTPAEDEPRRASPAGAFTSALHAAGGVSICASLAVSAL